MATDVTICSAALQLLGDSPITSLSGTERAAKICNNTYSLVRDEVLRAHPWNCLVTRAALSPLASEPVSGWSYQFAKPANFLRVLRVTDENDNDLAYVFESNRILANADTIYLHYLERKSEGSWDSNLVAVMTRRMQVELAYPITKSTSLRESLEDTFNRPVTGTLAMAKAVDGQENPPEEYGDSPLIAVRGG